MNLKTRKSEIRREIVARILAMSFEDRRAQEIELIRRFEDLPGLSGAKINLLYASAFPEEIDTRPILLRVLEMGKRLVLPKVHRPSKTLHLHEVLDLDKDLKVGLKGIPEPGPECSLVEASSIDWVLVPGLAFDAQGHRLGRGAGHYDKLLPRLRPDVPRWALILDTQWYHGLPIEPHDQPLDGVADAQQMILSDRESWLTR